MVCMSKETKLITILTPTYNRGYILSKAYQSLLQQTNKNFEWLIIDDGSVDNTKELINGFIEENKINIRYFLKKNGGKHTAVNEGVKLAKGYYTIILDSDDFLTDDAIEKINYYWEKYNNNKKIACLSFLKIYSDKRSVSKPYIGTEVISNDIDFKYNKGITGDMSEVYRTSILKKYPFPVFDDERFLSEAIVWNKIAFKYDTVFINKGIYVCEYLEDGLSYSCLKLRYNNPIGALENAKLFMNYRFKLLIRLKNAILYDGFSLIAKRQFGYIVRESNHKFLSILFYPAGILFKFWCTYEVKKGK